MATLDIKEYQGSLDLVDDNDLFQWFKEHEYTDEAEIPWEADHSGMIALFGFDANGLPWTAGPASSEGIVFGGPGDSGFNYVKNWVQVDDLGGLGALWCGSHSGIFYLRTDDPGNSAEPDIGPAQDGEEKGMLPACQLTEGGGFSLTRGMAAFPRAACPMDMRDKVLKVSGKWRSDVWWDTLINGQLCHLPPGTQLEEEWECEFSHFTLRLVQVGRWLCFHTQISKPDFTREIVRSEGPNGEDWAYIASWAVMPSRHRNIGYSSQWYGGMIADWGEWYGWGYPECHDATAEPPWGTNLNNSWTGAEDGPMKADGDHASTGCCGVTIGSDGATTTVQTGAHPYIRVYPRLHATVCWGRYALNGLGFDGDKDTIAAGLKNELKNRLFGISPEWCEERLGISDPYTLAQQGHSDWQAARMPRSTIYQRIKPSATFKLIVEDHLPHPGGKGSVYLALYTASIDNCLLTASILYPYGYINEAEENKDS